MPRGGGQGIKFGQQGAAVFRVIRIVGNTIDRAHLHTLRCIKMPHALGAACGIDLVMQRAVVDCAIWTFGFADVAINALRGDLKGHVLAYRNLSAEVPGCDGC